MIDPKSLRIGNRLMRNGLMVTIDAKTIYDIAYYPDTIGKQYEAVVLSPSLLEKAGFELSNDSFGGHLIELSKGERIRIIYDEKEGWIWPMNGYHHPSVPYFHTLQNLIFSLRGQELELKP